MVFFGMKAAVASYEQMLDRAARLQRLQLPIIIELHTFGDKDVYTQRGLDACRALVRQLRDRYDARLRLHVPPQAPNVVTRRNFDRVQVDKTLYFANEIDAEAVIVHRYWNLVATGQRSAIAKAEAEAAFQEEMVAVGRCAAERLVLVENLGHFWLNPPSSRRYLVGKLEHFFPWEIKRFAAFCAKNGLLNVAPMVDVAHACISANMFNMLRAYPAELRSDPRFQGITDDDLERQAWLSPYDFLAGEVRYFHASDAYFVNRIGRGRFAPRGSGVLTALTSEGLPLNRGNLNFQIFIDRLLALSNPEALVIAEISPGVGDSHDRNAAQEEAVRQWLLMEGRAVPVA